MDMSLAQADLYYGPPDDAGFCQALEAQVRGVPGVVSVSGIAHLPVGGGSAGRSVGIEGQPDPGDERRLGAAYTVACPNVLRTLGIKLLAGREFTRQDAVGTPAVALVNEAMARQFWSNGDAVGKRFKMRRGGLRQSVADSRRHLRQRSAAGARSGTAPLIHPAVQPGRLAVDEHRHEDGGSARLVHGAVKKALAIVEPNQPVSDIRTMDQVVGDSISSRRFPMLLLTGFAALALVLAAGGDCRGRRLLNRAAHAGDWRAHGAGRRGTTRPPAGRRPQFLVDAGRRGSRRRRVAGSATDSPGARLRSDPRPIRSSLGIVSLLLSVVALLASYVPARRAASVNPIEALSGVIELSRPTGRGVDDGGRPGGALRRVQRMSA